MANSVVKIDILAELKASISLNSILLNIFGGSMSVTVTLSGVIIPAITQETIPISVLGGINIINGIVLITCGNVANSVNRKNGLIARCYDSLLVHNIASYTMATEDALTSEYVSTSNELDEIQSLNVQRPVTPESIDNSELQPLQIPVTESGITTVTQNPNDSLDFSVEAVYSSLEQGISDSKIIKDVMRYGGTRYEKGRTILATLKNEWGFTSQQNSSIVPMGV